MLPSAFLSRVLPDVPGCPDVLATQAVMDAAIAIFEETQIWAPPVASSITLQNSVNDYAPTAPAGARVGRIKSVWCGAREVDERTPGNLSDVLPDWQTAKSSEPTYYTLVNQSTIRVYPMPDSVNGASIAIHASFVPLDDMSGYATPTIPDEYAIRYRDAIVAGAKASLMIVPDRKWSNERLAGFYKTQFDNALAEIKTHAIHAQLPGTITARPRSFG